MLATVPRVSISKPAISQARSEKSERQAPTVNKANAAKMQAVGNRAALAMGRR